MRVDEALRCAFARLARRQDELIVVLPRTLSSGRRSERRRERRVRDLSTSGSWAARSIIGVAISGFIARTSWVVSSLIGRRVPQAADVVTSWLSARLDRAVLQDTRPPSIAACRPVCAARRSMGVRVRSWRTTTSWTRRRSGRVSERRRRGAGPAGRRLTDRVERQAIERRLRERLLRVWVVAARSSRNTAASRARASGRSSRRTRGCGRTSSSAARKGRSRRSRRSRSRCSRRRHPPRSGRTPAPSRGTVRRRGDREHVADVQAGVAAHREEDRRSASRPVA